MRFLNAFKKRIFKMRLKCVFMNFKMHLKMHLKNHFKMHLKNAFFQNAFKNGKFFPKGYKVNL
jgi:hypothetical protein